MLPSHSAESNCNYTWRRTVCPVIHLLLYIAWARREPAYTARTRACVFVHTRRPNFAARPSLHFVACLMYIRGPCGKETSIYIVVLRRAAGLRILGRVHARCIDDENMVIVTKRRSFDFFFSFFLIRTRDRL